MPTETDKQKIIERVKQLLDEAKEDGVHLDLAAQRFDDDWLYLVVTPTRQGERASQHAHQMTRIERTLRGEGYDQVLLVPAVPEHAGLIDIPEKNE
ncbi:MAG: hypothetical protein ACFCVE_07260 [Phycisphaerae bacterium]